MKNKLFLSLFFIPLLFSFNFKGQDAIVNADKKTYAITESYNKKYPYPKQLKICKYILKNQELNDSLRLLILNRIGFLSNRVKQTDSAIFYTKKMLKVASADSNKSRGKAYFKLGIYFSKINQKDSSYYYYNLSKKEYKISKDSIYIVKNLRNISVIESNFGDYISSDFSAVEALKYMKEKDVNSRAGVYNTLAINYKKRKLYNEALVNYNKAIKLTTNKNYKITCKSNIANIYKEQKNYTKSITILESILKDSITNSITKARIIDNLAHIKWLNNPKIDVLKDLNLAKSIREKVNYNYGLITSFSHLSDYFSSTNKALALSYAKKMYALSKKENSADDRLEAINKIVALQPTKEAYKYFKESIAILDSIYQVENKRQYKFAKIKYDYELSEKQKLKFKNTAIENELKAKKEQNQKNNILYISLLLTSGLVFFIYKRKREHAKQLLQENYNTEIRLAKKLHDELGNDIFNTITKVQNPQIQSKEIIKDLDKIYLQTRAISHENDSIETGEKFEDFFSALLSSYNSEECNIILKGLSSLNLNKLNEQKQIVVYRVFNELLVNMKKHSKATLVVLSFQMTKNFLEFKYADNGVGFSNKKDIFKNGLKNVEIRIKSVQGKITFESELKKGLKVNFQIKK